MLIACPRCAARYEVADALIGPAGKSVRCAKCGHVWHATRAPAPAEADAPVQWPELPPAPERTELPAAPSSREPQATPAAAPAPTPVAETVTAGPQRARKALGLVALAGWLATVALLGTAAWGAYAYRDAVIEAWPPSERVYLALGLRH